MTGPVVGVHGIGNRQRGKTPAQAAAVVGDRWAAALRRGLGQQHGVEAVVAHYAHQLATDTTQGADDPQHLTEPEQEMLLRWAQQLGAPPEVAQGRLAAPARAAADWIARKAGLDNALVRLLVITFCREVHLYLSDPARRDAVRATVADTIAEQQPAAVIAHSLGSVVTYETLWTRPELQVDLLITLGSPLALPDVVFPKLHPSPEPRAPSAGRGTDRRGKAMDQHRRPRRLIAIPHGLARYFEGIDTDLTTPIGVFDTHKVTGYMACPTTAAALATLLGR
jgi:pimeloyl-ACP methyl ester carboxylesterase